MEMHRRSPTAAPWKEPRVALDRPQGSAARGRATRAGRSASAAAPAPPRGEPGDDCSLSEAKSLRSAVMRPCVSFHSTQGAHFLSEYRILVLLAEYFALER
jgi:hypothetical protein